jgi:hypothetical protein
VLNPQIAEVRGQIAEVEAPGVYACLWVFSLYPIAQVRGFNDRKGEADAERVQSPIATHFRHQASAFCN